ncbi:MAG TPA: restriction endonuclease subunit S [Candidatus Aphodovivens excrementavium]|nr:restriction endonuclease subunit S [Candidatus Aphodovivens excrementavium]
MAITLFNRECPQSNKPNATLSDIAQITMGQSPSGSSYNEDGNGEVFYQGRAEFGAFFPRRRLFTTEPKRMAREGDTLMSVRAPVGDLNVANEDCCIGRGLAAIHSESDQSFVHYLVRAQGRQLDAFNGDGTVFGSINGKSLKELPVFLPDNDAIAHLESQLKPIDALIRRNDDEIQALERMRDTLLPKLMSGDISVSQVEIPTQLNNHLSDCLASDWQRGRRPIGFFYLPCPAHRGSSCRFASPS